MKDARILNYCLSILAARRHYERAHSVVIIPDEKKGKPSAKVASQVCDGFYFRLGKNFSNLYHPKNSPNSQAIQLAASAPTHSATIHATARRGRGRVMRRLPP